MIYPDNVKLSEIGVNPKKNFTVMAMQAGGDEEETAIVVSRVKDVLNKLSALSDKAVETVKQAVAKDSDLSKAFNDVVVSVGKLVGADRLIESAKSGAESLVNAFIESNNRAIEFLENTENIRDLGKVAIEPLTSLNESLTNLKGSLSKIPESPIDFFDTGSEHEFE